MQPNSYPYFEFGFDTFNPLQLDVLPLIETDANVIVSAPTASGKSAIAEAAIGYTMKETQGKCVYASPFKALSAQKHDDWKGIFGKQMVLSTSDNLVSIEDMLLHRLMLVTYESLDAKIRLPSMRQVLDEIELVVLDEVHLIGQHGRGDRLEAMLMRLLRRKPDVRLIALSATMPNVKQFADWINSLSNRKTECVVNDYRPVKQQLKAHPYPDDWEDMLDEVVRLVQQNRGKTMVFVHSKRVGKEVVKRLGQKGCVSAFHHGGLTQSQRRKIEAGFNSYESGLDVIVSTSTLSSGMNMG